MNYSSLISKRRTAALAGAGALALSGLVAAAGSAHAAGTPCTATVTTGPGSCTITGTAAVGAGTLNESVPGSLDWTVALGTNLSAEYVDSVTADQGYTVSDGTTTGAGWHVTVDATTFTTGGATPANLPDTDALITNGSITDPASTTGPSANCTITGECTTPTNAVSYPVAITTAAATPTPVTVFNAAATTGRGSVDIGVTTKNPTATNPVGWWVHVPSNQATGSYTSTVHINLVSGPTV